jgi:hypothetical protein
VLHHRAGADFATPRQWHPRYPEAGKQGADAKKACPKAVYKFVGRRNMAEVICLQFNPIGAALDLNAEGGKDIGSRKLFSVSKLAAIKTRAEFFAPLTLTSPSSFLPPRISNWGTRSC